MKQADVLFLGPHPDDVEIAAAGTILRLVAAGKRVTVVDATRGEKGSRGTAAQRGEEATRAAALLGLQERHVLGLPDTAVAVDEHSERELVGVLRAVQPRLFFAPHPHDVHPDHAAVARLAERAFFLAGLVHYAPDLGEPHRPRLLVRFPGNHPVEPVFTVDVSDLVERKAEVIRCYASQLGPGAGTHSVQRLDLLERAQVRDRFFGARVGCVAAEPFWLDGPLPLRDLAALMPV